MPSSLPPELQHFVEQELTTGKYQSADELIREGLELLRERKLHELRRDLDAGLDQLDRGDGIHLGNEESLAAFFDDIKKRGRERLEAKQSGK